MWKILAENQHGKDEADVEITVLCEYIGSLQKLEINLITFNDIRVTAFKKWEFFKTLETGMC